MGCIIVLLLTVILPNEGEWIDFGDRFLLNVYVDELISDRDRGVSHIHAHCQDDIGCCRFVLVSEPGDEVHVLEL